MDEHRGANRRLPRRLGAGRPSRRHPTLTRGHPLYNARHHQSHAASFEPHQAGKNVAPSPVRCLRTGTVRPSVRAVAPCLGDSTAEGVPPPFDGILKLVELLERGEVPPHLRS
ncbi:MAG: hypothetical protein AAFU77_08675 [Myxococcota bacterium]